MTSKLKKLTKLIEEEKVGCAKPDVINEYTKEFENWIITYQKAEKDWIFSSQKSHVLKFIHVIWKLARNNENAIIDKYPIISNLMNILITPGNDPEIRKELITASFDIITNSIKLNVPSEYWDVPFYQNAFSLSTNKFDNMIVYIGSQRAAMPDDLYNFANILISRIQQISNREIFDYWWRIFCSSVIPCTVGKKKILKDKQKSEIEEKISEIFCQEISKSDKSLFFGDIKEDDPWSISQYGNFAKNLCESSLLILKYLFKKANQTPKVYSKYSKYIKDFFQKSFKIFALSPEKTEIINSSKLLYFCEGTRCETSLFTHFACSSTKKLEIILKTIVKFDDNHIESLKTLFQMSFSFYMHLFNAWNESRATKDKEKEKEILPSLANHHFFTMALGVEIMKITHVQDVVPAVLWNYKEDCLGQTAPFFMSLMINTKLLNKEVFVKYFKSHVRPSQLMTEIIQLFSSILAFEEFRIYTENEQMKLLDSAYEVFIKIPNNTTESLANFQLLTDSTMFFLYSATVLSTLSKEEIKKFREDFFDCVDCVSKYVGSLTYAEMWILLSNKYYTEDEIEQKNIYNPCIFETIIPKALNEILTKYKISSSFELIRVISSILSDRKMYNNLDTESRTKWVNILLKLLKEEMVADDLVVVIDSCINLLLMEEKRALVFIKYLPRAIETSLKETKSEKTKPVITIEREVMYTKILISSVLFTKSLPREEFNQIIEKAEESLFSLMCPGKANSPQHEEINILGLTFVIILMLNDYYGMSISFIASIIPLSMSIPLIRILPMLAEVAKKCNEGDNSALGKIIHPLEQLKADDSKETEKNEIIYNLSLFAAMLLMEIPDNKAIRETCINYISTGRHFKRSFSFFSSSFMESSTYFDGKPEISNSFISFEDGKDKSVTLDALTGYGKTKYQVDFEGNDALNLTNRNMSLAIPLPYIKKTLFPLLQNEEPSNEFLYNTEGGIIMYVAPGQKDIVEAAANDIKHVSKEFLSFVKSIGKPKKNCEVAWNFYMYKLTPVLLPMVQEKIRSVTADSHTISIIWDNSKGTFSPEKKTLNSTKCEIVLKPMFDNFILVRIYKFEPFNSIIGPLMDNMIVSKEILPFLLRWTLVSFFTNTE